MDGPWMSSKADRRLRICLEYEGLWERLGCWLLAIDWRTGETWREVPQGSLRDRLADFCDRRDSAWRTCWAARGTEPPARWKRRESRLSHEVIP